MLTLQGKKKLMRLVYVSENNIGCRKAEERKKRREERRRKIKFYA